MNRNWHLIFYAMLIAVTGCARATLPPVIPTPETARATAPTATTKSDAMVYYPTQVWKTSSPEQQGTASQKSDTR